MSDHPITDMAFSIISLRQQIATLTAERDALFVLTDRLTAERDALRAERDEARRELCRIESSASGDPNMTSRAVAADCGWDCFKEDGK
jgi:hypothetical protein